jgi:hypothetical protein
MKKILKTVQEVQQYLISKDYIAEPVAPKFNSKRGTNGHVTHYTRVYMDEYSLPSSDGYHKVQ